MDCVVSESEKLICCHVGIKFKVENPKQYEEYLRELEPIRQELGISLKEWMYPDN